MGVVVCVGEGKGVEALEGGVCVCVCVSVCVCVCVSVCVCVLLYTSDAADELTR